MLECKRHPSQSQPGGGVCASCLRERLVRLWRGQSFHLDDDDNDNGDELASTAARVGSLAGVRLQLQVNGVAKPEPSSIVDDGDTSAGTVLTTTETPTNIMVEWTEFHAQRRRRNSEQGATAKSSRSMDSLEFKPLVDRLVMDADADAAAAARPRAIRSRSMPMHNRRAEETALRVIREVQSRDGLPSDELELGFPVESLQTPEQRQQQQQQQQQRCRQCGIWFLSNSPKWVSKLLMSPINPSRNKQKVFPSRLGSKKRRARFNSADWSHSDDDASGVPHWIASALPATDGADAAGARQRRSVASMRSSVFSWLQDADRTMIRNYDPTRARARARSFPGAASESTEFRPQDLTTVGHLHEIVEEELEIVEDSDFEDTGAGAADVFRDIASFGNFLRSAALRHPHAHLTRLASAA